MSAAPTTNPTSAWLNGPLPPNVRVGDRTIISGEHAFKRFRAQKPDALVIGTDCTLDGVHFAIEKDGRIAIGNFCYFTNSLLLCETGIRIGNYVMMGWNSSIADSDFHPIAPAERIADAIACSPLGNGLARPQVSRAPVVIGDHVWIGANVTILKGVTVGDRAFIEPGSLITRDVPPRARMLGNPAQIIGEVS